MKSLFCFCGMVLLIFPLFNVQKKDIFALENISSVYFVREENGESFYDLQEERDFSQSELAKNQGVILTFENTTIEEVSSLLNMKKVKVEKIDDMEIFYGWTEMYDEHILLDGKQVNVQILERQSEIIAGFPIILSGF